MGCNELILGLDPKTGDNADTNLSLADVRGLVRFADTAIVALINKLGGFKE